MAKYVILPYDRYMSLTRCDKFDVKHTKHDDMVMDPAVKDGFGNKTREMILDPAVRSTRVNIHQPTVMRRSGKKVVTKRGSDTPLRRANKKEDTGLTRRVSDPPMRSTNGMRRGGKKTIPPAPPGVLTRWIKY
jgi:hypothetical protein